MATQTYHSQINLSVPGRRDLAVIYRDTTGPAGMTADQVRAEAERAALAEIPNGTVVGSHICSDGTSGSYVCPHVEFSDWTGPRRG